jgi:hypothetical protein
MKDIVAPGFRVLFACLPARTFACLPARRDVELNNYYSNVTGYLWAELPCYYHFAKRLI